MKPVVDASWLERHIDDPNVVVIEVDERHDAYDQGHVPGSHRIDSARDLADPVVRDLPDRARMERLLGSMGVDSESTIVLYGDSHNCRAAWAFWVLRLFGAPNLRLLDGGRELWIAQDRPLDESEPNRIERTFALRERDDSVIRANREDVARFVDRALGPLVDVRSAAEYGGSVAHVAGFPGEGSARAGRIPGAVNVPWRCTLTEDGAFRPVDELRELYARAGVTGSEPVITYGRIGERAAHGWFVLSELLGLDDVRHYDGSWIEWSNLVGAPIEMGTA